MVQEHRRSLKPAVEAVPDWNVEDDAVSGQPPVFGPERPSGLHLPENVVPQSESDIFNLFFTDFVLATLADATNEYAWLNILDCPSQTDKYGGWKQTDAHEIKTSALLTKCNGSPKSTGTLRATTIWKLRLSTATSCLKNTGGHILVLLFAR